MALPSSGPLSFSQIGAALCTPQSAPYSLRSMSAAAGFSTPDSVSEFYGYSCPSYTVTISAHRNGIAADTTYISYSTGSGFTEVPSSVARGTSCVTVTTITVTSGTVVSLIQRNVNAGVYVPASASTSACPSDFTGELCQNQFTISGNTTIYLYVDTANTTFGC